MTPPRTVLLVHTLPEGHAHIDWMLDIPAHTENAPAPTPAHRLQTYRVVARIDRAPFTPFLAVPLAPHRAAYLTYQGPVSNARGDIRRIAEGHIINHDAEATAPAVTIAWATAGEPRTTVRYTLAHHPANPSLRLVAPTPALPTGARSRI